jgi:hypothetical protein
MVSSFLFLDLHEHLGTKAPRARREEILPWQANSWTYERGRNNVSVELVSREQYSGNLKALLETTSYSL